MSTLPIFPLPHAPRNQVWEAAFAFLKTAPSPTSQQWKTFSQMLKMYDEVSAGEQPAMYLHRGPETAEQKHAFGVIKWTWKATVWVYYRVDGYKTENFYPDKLTDQFKDSIEQLFQTDPLNGRLTLGGLVHHCWIDGTIYTDPGVSDNQAVIIVPISILV